MKYVYQEKKTLSEENLSSLCKRRGWRLTRTKEPHEERISLAGREESVSVEDIAHLTNDIIRQTNTLSDEDFQMVSDTIMGVVTVQIERKLVPFTAEEEIIFIYACAERHQEVHPDVPLQNYEEKKKLAKLILPYLTLSESPWHLTREEFIQAEDAARKDVMRIIESLKGKSKQKG